MEISILSTRRNLGNLILYRVVLSMKYLHTYKLNILQSFVAKRVGDNLKRLIRSSCAVFIKELRYQ